MALTILITFVILFLLMLLCLQEKQATRQRRAIIEILTRHVGNKWSDRG
jgi:amino acid permease